MISATRLPDMLVLNLGISRVGGPEGRQGRAEQALPDVSHAVWIFRVEPPRVVLHDRRQIAAQRAGWYADERRGGAPRRARALCLL